MPVENACGVEELANELLTALTEGKEFTFDPVDLEDPDFQLPEIPPGGDNVPAPLTNEMLTTRTVDGAGTFDALMKSVSVHIKAEHEAGRINGAEYANVYFQATQAAMGNAVQFLLGRDQAYWGNITAQLQAQVVQAAAIEARVKLEIAKAQLQMIVYESQTAEANYALTKMKLATESVNYCTARFQLEEILPEQKSLVEEQVEERRAQTLDTRRDTTAVTGVIGKQKDLYSEQITSYKRDAEVKVAKLFTDAWITMKTLDEGLLPPDAYVNANLDVLLSAIQANVNLD